MLYFLTFKLAYLWLYIGKRCKTILFRKPEEFKTGRRTCYFFIFAFCHFPNFKWLLSISYNRFRVFLESSIRQKYFWSTHFWHWNSSPFKFLWNLYRNAFSFFIFSKWMKHCNLPFGDTFKMYCCAFLFTFILTRLLSKKLWNNYHFLTQISKNSFQDVVYYKILGRQTLRY